MPEVSMQQILKDKQEREELLSKIKHINSVTESVLYYESQYSLKELQDTIERIKTELK